MEVRMSPKSFFSGTMLILVFVLVGTSFGQSTLPSLAGSWEVKLVPNPNLTGSNSVVPGLATFTTDGSAIETDSSEIIPGQILPNTFATPGHGIWQPGPAIGNLFVQFTSLVTNPDGSLRAKKIYTMTVRLTANRTQFKGGYNFELVNPTGQQGLGSGSGTVTGQLIVHPLLP
jgi:hypothetical protein